MLYMDLEYCKGILFVRLDGNLTRRNVYRINNYLAPVLKKHRIKYLVYNLNSILDVDRSGVDALLRTKYVMKHIQEIVYLCEVPQSLKKYLRKLRIKELDSELKAYELLNI